MTRFLTICLAIFSFLGAEGDFIDLQLSQNDSQNQGKDRKMEEKPLLPKYYSKVLENGLEAYLIPLANRSGVIETTILYKVGSRNEVMGKSGIAHMLEHLNFKSTKNLRAGEFDEIVKKFGGLTNASTSFDFTSYYIRSSAQNLDKSLELFAELLQNLNLEDSEFQSERNVVAEERRWRTDNSPLGYLYFRFFNTAYVYHPYHWTPIGFMDDIKNWKIEEIRDFHKTYYQPKNAVIVVAGDIDPNLAFDQIKKHFEPIANRDTDIPEVYTIEPKQDGARFVEIRKDTQIEYFALGFKIPNFKHKDQVALEVLSELLSGGKSSFLYDELVDKKRIASEVYTYPMDLRDESVFLIMVAGNKGIKAEQLQEEIKKLLSSIQRGQISQSDLDKAILNIRASFIFQLENASNLVSLFGGYLAKGDLSPLLNFENNLKALKVEDVVEVAKKYFIDSQSTSVILRK